MKRLIIGLIALLLLFVFLLSWIALSEAGLQWAYKQMRGNLAGDLQIKRLEGKLIGPILAGGAEFKLDGINIKAAQIELEWNPLALLTAKFDISRLHIESLDITLARAGKRSSTQITPAEIRLPWRTSVAQFEIDGFALRRAEQSLLLRKINLDASSLFSNVEIHKLRVIADKFSLDLQGELDTSGEYQHQLAIKWQATLPSSALIEGSGQIVGDFEATHIQQQVSGALNMTLEAGIKQVFKRFDWQASIKASTSNLAQLIVDSPQISAELALQAQGDLSNASASGTLNGVYADIGAFDASFALRQRPDRRVQIERLELKLPTSNTRVSATGLWMPAGEFGSFRLALDWEKLRWPLQGDAWFDTSKGSGNFEGNLEHYRFDLTTDNPLALAPPSTWYASAQGDLQGLVLQSFRITAAEAEASGNGQINWSPRLSWQTSIDAEITDLAKLLGQGPQLNGKLSVKAQGDLNSASANGGFNGDNADSGPFEARFTLQSPDIRSVEIERLVLRTVNTDSSISAQGQWQPGDHGGNFNLALDWRQLRWPLAGDAWFDQVAGTGHIEGNFDHFEFSLSSDARLAQAGLAGLAASGDGDLKGLNINSLRLQALNGETLASGRLSWSPELLWQAQVSATDIDPGMLLPDWPGRIDASFSNSGRIENKRLSIDSEITRLTGKLRDYPVSLRSRLSWNEQGFDIRELDFSSGSSLLNARGLLGDKLELEWNITSSNLAELYPQAQGEFIASGKLSGPRKTPLIEAIMHGNGLSLPGYEVASAEASLAIDMAGWRQFDIKLDTGAIKLPGYALQSLEIRTDTKQLLADITAQDFSARLALKGEFKDRVWRGRVERADIHSQRFANWQLQAPAQLSVGETTFQLDSICWINSRQASLCSSLQRQQQQWQGEFVMQHLPLLLLNNWLPADLQLEGTVNGSASLQYRDPDELFGQAELELAPGMVSYALQQGERDLWEYNGGKLNITLDRLGLRTISDIAINQLDRLSLNLDLPGARLLDLDPQLQNLVAEAHLSVSDLGLVEAILPEVQDFKGELLLDISARGTLAQPRLSGQALLTNATLQIPRLGLSLDKIGMQARSDGFKKVNLSLQAHSGEGSLAIEGESQLDRAAGWPTQISIKGDRFEVSRIPEARVLVSPDLQVKLHHREIATTGTVTIPYAKLQPTDTSTAARVSSDAVISGDTKVAEENWAITSRIRLILGDAVNFFGFGFEGRFDGNLLLEDEPGQLIKASGEINIPQGRYRAYGQKLDVEQGRLLYTGGPLTNPGLNLTAVRHVEDITAGIRVRGTLNQPQLELFSTPTMGETDTLSYLVLGRPLETASGEEGSVVARAALALGLSGGDRIARSLGERLGLDEVRVESGSEDQASLVVGRYLSPRLYVTYGVGLIETINTFSLRYKISDKWQLKAESGEAQGADLLYTISR